MTKLKLIVNNHYGCPPKGQDEILSILKEIKVDMNQLKAALAAVQAANTQTLTVVQKISGETQSLLLAIVELQNAVAAANNLPDDVIASVNSLVEQATAVTTALAAVDALVPDAPLPVDPEPADPETPVDPAPAPADPAPADPAPAPADPETPQP